MRKDIDSRLDYFKSSIKAGLAADLGDIRDEISTRVSTTPNILQQKDLSFNIVIRNLPESHNENTKSKVNAIFRDGLKPSDISVEDAERKQPHSESKPGVIVARMNSKQDKQRVMKEKSRLKDSRQFSKVYINHDQHPSERSVSTNFRKILHAMKSNKNNLMMKGSRVVYNDGNSNSSKPDDSGSYHHRQSASRGSLNNGQNPRERSDRTDGDRSGSHVVNRSYSGGWRKVNRGASRHDSRPNSRDARAQGNYRWRDQIAAGFWNVRGWKTSVDSDNNTVRSNCVLSSGIDILGIAETHLLGNDVLELEGYKWYGNSRKLVNKNVRNGSGGVGFFIRNELLINFDVTVLEDSCEGILILKLSHKRNALHLIPCVCYVPPENSSRFFDINKFYDSLFSYIYKYQNEGILYVCGDFNSRCGDLDDFIRGIDDVSDRNIIDFNLNRYGKIFL